MMTIWGSIPWFGTFGGFFDFCFKHPNDAAARSSIHTQRRISLHHLVSSDPKCLLFGSPLWYHILAICPELPFELPRWLSGKESACQCSRRRECKFDTWVGKIPWRRKWQFTPVFLPGEFHWQRSLMVYRPWNLKEADRSERLNSAPELL